jgi:hypothetical protein
VLEGRTGPIVADSIALRAVASRHGYRAGSPGPAVWVLIHRPLPATGHTTPPERKYDRSNAPADPALAELLRIFGLRWPKECCLEEGTGELGLDQDALRFWRGGITT